MNKNKFTEKLKEGVSVKEIEEFARQHTAEVFSVLAIVIATISSSWDFFTGARLSLFFLALGGILAILLPAQVEQGMKRVFDFSFKQEKSTQMILGAVQIVAAIFVPFLMFGMMGLLAGGSYHYYVRHAEIVSENRPMKGRKAEPGEHD